MIVSLVMTIPVTASEPDKFFGLREGTFWALTTCVSAVTAPIITYGLVHIATSTFLKPPFVQPAALVVNFYPALQRAKFSASMLGFFSGLVGGGTFGPSWENHKNHTLRLLHGRNTFSDALYSGFASGLITGIFTYGVTLPTIIRQAVLHHMVM